MKWTWMSATPGKPRPAYTSGRSASVRRSATPVFNSQAGDVGDVLRLLGVCRRLAEEGLDHLDRDVRRQPLEAERQYVGVVPLAGAARNPRLPGQRGPDPGDRVGGDRRPGARPAHHDAEVGPALGHS